MVLFLFVFSVFSAVSASPKYVIVSERVETKCQVVDGSGNVSVGQIRRGNVSLNGTVVEEVNCGNIEAYDFPEPYTTGGGTHYETPSLLEVAIFIGLPVSGLLLVVFGFYRHCGLDRRNIGKTAGISFASILAVVVSFLGANSVLSGEGLTTVVLSLLMFGGPFVPSLITYIWSRKKEMTHWKAYTGIAFLFSMALVWTLVFYQQATAVITA